MAGTLAFPVHKMFKVVRLQFVMAILAVALSGALLGVRGAISAACGGAACFVPTLVFAWRLRRAQARPGASPGATFLAGELLKIGATIGILFLVRLLYPEAQWGAVVLGVAFTLQANFLALIFRT